LPIKFNQIFDVSFEVLLPLVPSKATTSGSLQCMDIISSNLSMFFEKQFMLECSIERQSELKSQT